MVIGSSFLIYFRLQKKWGLLLVNLGRGGQRRGMGYDLVGVFEGVLGII
jgi:hypothetical protein